MDKCLAKPQLYDSCQFSNDLKSLASSLTSTFERKHCSRYDFIDLPSYKEVGLPALKACEALLKNDSQVEPSEELGWKVQGVLVVCLQTLVAPMRGKPFWDNVLSESKLSSMTLHPHLFHSFVPHRFH